MKNIFNDQKLKFLKDNYPLKGGRFCAEQLGVSVSVVYGKASRLGLNRHPLSKSETYSKSRRDFCRKNPKLVGYNVELNQFLDIQKPVLAYFLGFLWADGYIEPRKGSLVIEVVKEDGEELLEAFRDIGIWKTSYRKRKTGREQISLKTNNRLLANFLISMGYKKKHLVSPAKILKRIPENLHCNFWHGFFDGDGCLYMGKKTISLQFWGSFDQDWSSLIKFLDLNGLTHRIQKYDRILKNKKPAKSSTLGIRTQLNMYKLLNLFYNGTVAGLGRKFNKFLLLKNKMLKSFDKDSDSTKNKI